MPRHLRQGLCGKGVETKNALTPSLSGTDRSSLSSSYVTYDVKQRLDIVDVVSQYVPALQKAGRNYKALCPFHTEKTPSFVVFPDRQSWRCFGACATGGDIFTFVMRREQAGFSDTLKQLAQRAGVSVPERQVREEHQALLQVNEAAATFF